MSTVSGQFAHEAPTLLWSAKAVASHRTPKVASPVLRMEVGSTLVILVNEVTMSRWA